MKRQADRPHIHIAGIGGYLPERILTNADLAGVVDTTDEWIRSARGSANAILSPLTR